MNKLEASYTTNRLMNIITARTKQGRLPKIPREVRPAIVQIAHAQVSMKNLLKSSLQFGIRLGEATWDHYGIAVENAEIYQLVVKQLLALGYTNTGLTFSNADAACFLLSQAMPLVPIKVFVETPFSGKNRAQAHLSYLAFSLGFLGGHEGVSPSNRQFDELAASTQKPIIGKEMLGIDQRGVKFPRKEIAAWGTTQAGILADYTFSDVMILDRLTPKS